MNRFLSIENSEFEFQGNKVRFIFDENNNPWFRGIDIATLLGYKNGKSAIYTHVDQADKLYIEKIQTISLSNCHPHTVFINESGLYTLILRSTLPDAKIFKRWITSEVIPSIRKAGEYKIRLKHKGEIDHLNSELLSRTRAIESMNNELRCNAEAIEYMNNELQCKVEAIEYLNNENQSKTEIIEYIAKDLQSKNQIIECMNYYIQVNKQNFELIKPDITPKTVKKDLFHYFILLKLFDEKHPYDYYVVRVQKRNIAKSIRQVLNTHPNAKELIRYYDPNAVNLYARIKERLTVILKVAAH